MGEIQKDKNQNPKLKFKQHKNYKYGKKYWKFQRNIRVMEVRKKPKNETKTIRR